MGTSKINSVKKTHLDIKDLILILCIDRDNDIGIKISRQGPIVGREENLKTAVNLAIKDPSESDANCIFGAIKEYDKQIKKNENCQILTITGDRDVGIKSDKLILRQLDGFINSTKYKITECYVISDGAEDEQLLPLIRSRIEIVQSKRIVISQSVPLESMYYTIINFSKTIIEDPKLSRVFLGIPAIVLLIFTIFGSAGFRLIVGLIGLFFLIKGFYLETAIESMYNEMKNSLKTRKYSILLYLCSISLFVIGASGGYSAVQSALAPDIIVKSAIFIKSSALFFFLSAISAGIGRIFSKQNYKKNFFPFLTFSSLCFSVIYILYQISVFLIDNTVGYNKILIAVAISALLVGISIFLEKHFK
ncbi:MAG: hypothetical protein B6U87_01615 [Candidatus Aenigmarchaeota archaeon ex4484_52]|nr:MAG: hypothetical protein B6U87_01615 [Candidatus Aenigmarchaeota archaeon ex4484_52]